MTRRAQHTGSWRDQCLATVAEALPGRPVSGVCGPLPRPLHPGVRGSVERDRHGRLRRYAVLLHFPVDRAIHRILGRLITRWYGRSVLHPPVFERMSRETRSNGEKRLKLAVGFFLGTVTFALTTVTTGTAEAADCPSGALCAPTPRRTRPDHAGPSTRTTGTSQASPSSVVPSSCGTPAPPATCGSTASATTPDTAPGHGDVLAQRRGEQPGVGHGSVSPRVLRQLVCMSRSRARLAGVVAAAAFTVGCSPLVLQS